MFQIYRSTFEVAQKRFRELVEPAMREATGPLYKLPVHKSIDFYMKFTNFEIQFSAQIKIDLRQLKRQHWHERAEILQEF